ncbi:hypothetical protein llap_5723 [Limosa lapponica baueri]|uniref:Uncharacterized protein n=1 Tax=Limosa lapponica baueri TaxID=1758121 RepID=A0A2I0UD91_LIMLA|nr:hypothetical protein llap_5723 [Limosa lapponica baueri]
MCGEVGLQRAAQQASFGTMTCLSSIFACSLHLEKEEKKSPSVPPGLVRPPGAWRVAKEFTLMPVFSLLWSREDRKNRNKKRGKKKIKKQKEKQKEKERKSLKKEKEKKRKNQEKVKEKNNNDLRRKEKRKKKGKGTEGKGREGKGRKGKGREEKGREGKKRQRSKCHMETAQASVVWAAKSALGLYHLCWSPFQVPGCQHSPVSSYHLGWSHLLVGAPDTPSSVSHIPRIILEKQVPWTVSGGCSWFTTISGMDPK